MTKTETSIGRIVVVVDATAFGNQPGTVTKVLSRPGAVQDLVFEAIGTRYPMHDNTVVMCEKKSDFVSDHTPRFLNKPAVYEHVNDLRPATECEKQLYRKSK